MARKCANCDEPIDEATVVSVRIAHPDDGPKKDYFCSTGCVGKAFGTQEKPEPRSVRVPDVKVTQETTATHRRRTR